MSFPVEREQLLMRHLDGRLSVAESRELAAWLREDAAARAWLRELAEQAVALGDLGREKSWREPVAKFPSAREHRPASPRFPRATWLALAAAVAVAFVLTWFRGGGSVEQDILHITALNGAVRWTGAGGQVRDGLKVGGSLPGGVVEALSDDSTVTLAFHDGTAITLLSRSMATLAEDGQKRVHLREGSLSADVKPQPRGQPLVIHTPTALLEVLGTRFDVDSDEANTRLAVSEGRVRMTRLVDGSVAEVPAQHEAVVSLNRAEDVRIRPRGTPEVIWRSDLASGAQGTQGRWLPARDGQPARLAADAVFLPETTRGAVTIHRLGFKLPWRNLEAVQISPQSRLRIQGRTRISAPLEIMLCARHVKGGYAGNFFHETATREGRWQIEVPVADFRKWTVKSGERPPEALRLQDVVIYTINTDADLEVESVEVVRQ